MKTMIICLLALSLWLTIILVYFFKFFKKIKSEKSVEEKAMKEAEALLYANKKVRLITSMIKNLEACEENEKNRVRIRILKTKLKIMVSNPVVREAVIQIKKIKK